MEERDWGHLGPVADGRRRKSSTGGARATAAARDTQKARFSFWIFDDLAARLMHGGQSVADPPSYTFSASSFGVCCARGALGLGANVDFLPSVRIFLSFLSSLFRAPPRQICEKFLRPVTPCSSFAPFAFRVRKQGVPHVGPGTVRACRALLEPAGPRGSDGAPPRRG